MYSLATKRGTCLLEYEPADFVCRILLNEVSLCILLLYILTNNHNELVITFIILPKMLQLINTFVSNYDNWQIEYKIHVLNKFLASHKWTLHPQSFIPLITLRNSLVPGYHITHEKDIVIVYQYVHSYFFSSNYIHKYWDRDWIIIHAIVRARQLCWETCHICIEDSFCQTLTNKTLNRIS